MAVVEAVPLLPNLLTKIEYAVSPLSTVRRPTPGGEQVDTVRVPRPGPNGLRGRNHDRGNLV